MIEVIKYTDDENTLVFPYYLEDINLESEIIVKESQEAFLYYNNQFKKHLLPGTYTLGSVVDSDSVKETSDKTIIYFVNKTKQLDMNWGIGGVNLTEPLFGVDLNTGAHGKISFTILDNNLFLKSFIQPDKELTQDEIWDGINFLVRERIRSLFTDIVSSENRIDYLLMEQDKCLFVDGSISDFLVIKQQDMLLSDLLNKKVACAFDDFGLQLVDFTLIGVLSIEEAVNWEHFCVLLEEKYKCKPIIQVVSDLPTKPKKYIPHNKVDNSEVIPSVLGIGLSDFNLVEKIIRNDSVDMYSTAYMGIGLSAAVDYADGLYKDELKGIGTPFTTINIPPKNKKEKLLELKELFEMEFITEEEYHTQKAEILSEN